MTVYVDDVVDWGEVALSRGLPGSLWAHLVADDRAELHAFAERLGLRRSWFQHAGADDPLWHYDVTAGKRAQALRMGAVAISASELSDLIDSRRRALRPAAPVPSLGRHVVPGVTPGTAVCLTCDVPFIGEREGQGTESDRHVRATGHTVISRPLPADRGVSVESQVPNVGASSVNNRTKKRTAPGDPQFALWPEPSVKPQMGN